MSSRKTTREELWLTIQHYRNNNKEIEECKKFNRDLVKKQLLKKKPKFTKQVFVKGNAYKKYNSNKNKVERQVKIKCSYITPIDDIYGCSIGRERIPSDVSNCKFVGDHVDGKTNLDVTEITFSLCDIPNVPQGLTKIYPNLEMINIQFSNLKNICRDDLFEYRNFKMLFFHFNEIEFLPGDLLEDCEKLEKVSFRNNNLRFIEPNILEGHDKLSFVSFVNNPRYNTCYYGENSEEECNTIADIKSELISRFFTGDYIRANTYLRMMHYRYQILKQKNENLRIFNDKFSLNKDLLIKENEILRNDLELEQLKSQELSSQPQKGLFADVKKYIQNDKTKNFKIQIDGREFHVHKFLLIARSSTFADMLQNNPEVEQIRLVDIPVEIFDIILKFLYTDELPPENGTDFVRLFATAGRLKIDELKNYAADKIFKLINMENALEIFKLSNKCEHDGLRSTAFKEIKKKYPKIEFKEEWVSEPDKIFKIIELFNKKEEMLRKMDEEFQKLVCS